MEWKEFILIFLAGIAIFTVILTAQSMFAISNLNSIDITFEISPETMDFINKTQEIQGSEKEVACIGTACSVGLLTTEQIVACYNGCKFYNDALVGNCMDYCEDFYEVNKDGE